MISGWTVEVYRLLLLNNSNFIFVTELGTEKDLNPKPDENVIVVKCVESADPVKPIGKKELLILLTCNSFIMGRLLVVSCLVPQEGTEN